MIQLVIFDMAGTAVNEDNTVYKTVQKAIQNAGFTVKLEEVLTHGAGKEKRVAISDVLTAINANVTENQIDAIHSDFRQMLSVAYDEADITLFSSVANVLCKLKELNIKTAFNTGYKRAMAEFLLNKINVEEGRDIDCLVASDDVDRGRPNPDMIDLICEQLSIPTTSAVKIGDSIIDIEEGKAASVALTIGVTTGAQTRSELASAEPDYIIDDMTELLKIIANAKA